MRKEERSRLSKGTLEMIRGERREIKGIVSRKFAILSLVSLES
jgi:hypothetical protein